MNFNQIMLLALAIVFSISLLFGPCDSRSDTPPAPSSRLLRGCDGAGQCRLWGGPVDLASCIEQARALNARRADRIARGLAPGMTFFCDGK